MPIETLIVLFAIASAFIVFGMTLAWASHQTSHLNRQVQQRSGEGLDAQASLRVIGVGSTPIPADSNKRLAGIGAQLSAAAARQENGFSATRSDR